MRKADSIRAWLTAYLPELKIHPDRLQVWIEGGKISARRSRTLSYSYSYSLKIGVWEFAGNADHLTVPILAWIEKEQPQLLRREDSEPFGFECELLDGDVSDVLISIDLTETVIVTPREDGSGYDIVHAPEPPQIDAFAGPAASFAQIIANDEILP
jgi:hypothetical protein